MSGSFHQDEELDAFARRFFDVLGVPAVEHASVLQPDKRFYQGRLGLLHFKVTRCESVQQGSHSCNIAIESKALDSDALLDEVNSLLVGVMKPRGFRLGRMVAVGRVSGHSADE